MVSEKIYRKIDNTGRLSIPKHLRLKFDCTEGTEVEIFTHVEDGINYICFKPVENEVES